MKSTHKKHHVSLIVYLVSIFAALIIGVTGAFFAIGLRLNDLKQSENQVAVPAEFSKVVKAYQTIRSNYVTKESQAKLINGAVDGMVKSLNDPFSEYLPSSDATDLNDTISGSFDGIGAEVQQSNHVISIISPIAGSPAKKAGLRANDIIQKVDGKATTGKTVSQVVKQIRGKKGTKVTLTIKRGTQTFNVSITRGTVPVKTVSAHLESTDKKVGYLQVSTFSEPTTKEFKAAIEKLRSEGATSFVVDMRGNPGGLMEQALEMSSMFLEDGKTIMQVAQRGAEPVKYLASKNFDAGFKVTEPTIILIDDGSASSAEIFAAALNQSAGIQLFGTKSFGKGTVQTMTDFGDKSEMKITTAKWLTPSGNWIHKKGLEPTTKADYPDYAYLPLFRTTKTYALNQVSDSVGTIQKALRALGYTTDSATGYYGPLTQNAVAQFQAQNGLSSTGAVNEQTANNLIEQLQNLVIQNDNAQKAAVAALK